MNYLDYLTTANGAYFTVHSEAVFTTVIIPLWEVIGNHYPNFKTFLRAIEHIPVEGLIDLAYYGGEGL